MGWVVNATPRPLYPGKVNRYPLCGKLGGPKGRSGQVRKTSPLPGFEPWTVQHAASHNTDYAIAVPSEQLQDLDSSSKVCNWSELMNPFLFLDIQGLLRVIVTVIILWLSRKIDALPRTKLHQTLEPVRLSHVCTTNFGSV